MLDNVKMKATKDELWEVCIEEALMQLRDEKRKNDAPYDHDDVTRLAIDLFNKVEISFPYGKDQLEAERE